MWTLTSVWHKPQKWGRWLEAWWLDNFVRHKVWLTTVCGVDCIFPIAGVSQKCNVLAAKKITDFSRHLTPVIVFLWQIRTGDVQFSVVADGRCYNRRPPIVFTIAYTRSDAALPRFWDPGLGERSWLRILASSGCLRDVICRRHIADLRTVAFCFRARANQSTTARETVSDTVRSCFPAAWAYESGAVRFREKII